MRDEHGRVKASNAVPREARAALLVALFGGAVALADYANPGPFAAGWVDVTVTRPGGGDFDARLFYPALTSGQGAAYAGGGAPYPAVTFGHGWITAVTRYQSTLEHLATWGYFVIASYSYGGLFPDHDAFADDLRWCLTHLENEHQNPTSWLYGQVDTTSFGASGHSMGGGASILATARDTRIRALANLAAAETNPSAIAAISGVRTPVCLVAGDEDGIVPPGQHTIPMYEQARAPRRLPLLDGGWHCGFLDSSFFGCDSGSLPRATQLALTRRTLTAFFSLYLKDEQAAWRQVWGPELYTDPLVDNSRADAGIACDPNQVSAHGYGGQIVQPQFVLTNSGPLPTSYTLFVEDNAWPTTATPVQTPVLSPGEFLVISVRVEIPDLPGVAVDTSVISARADADGGTRGYAIMTTARRLRGDLNGDGVVNAADFAALAGCMQGPDAGLAGGCGEADLDLDDDADLADYAVLQMNCGAGT